MEINNPQISPQYFDLIKMIITLISGAIIAIFSQTAPKLLDWWLSSVKETKNTRKENIEKAILLAYQFNDWVDHDMRTGVFGETKNIISNPEAKLVILTKIYLPELKDEWVKVEARAAQISSWARKSGLKRLDATPQIGKEPKPLPNLMEGLEEVYKPYREAFNIFVNKVIQLASNDEKAV